MIRTKDLLIFIAVLFFLVLCITLTLLGDIRFSSKESWDLFKIQNEDLTTFTAEGPSTDIDRESIIDRLRNVLAQRDIEIEPSPSVESVVEETASTTQETEEATDTAQLCSDFNAAEDIIRSWPLTGVSFTVEGSRRNVVHAQAPQTGIDINASSTASSSVTVPAQVLLSVPVSPALASPSCVGSEVIGVTVAGALMFNSEAAFYRGYGSEYLIGYARDGFPIYGYFEGQLDSCGGYTHAQGYRYSISKDGSTVLNCFSATPASFIE